MSSAFTEVLSAGDSVGAKFLGCRLLPAWQEDEADIELFFVFALQPGKEKYTIPWAEDVSVHKIDVDCCVMTAGLVEDLASKFKWQHMAGGFAEWFGKRQELGSEESVQFFCDCPFDKALTRKMAGNIMVHALPLRTFSLNEDGYSSTPTQDTAVATPGVKDEPKYVVVRYRANRPASLHLRVENGALSTAVAIAHWIDCDSVVEHFQLELRYPVPPRSFKKLGRGCVPRQARLLARVEGAQDFTGRDCYSIYRHKVRPKDETSISVWYEEVGANSNHFFHLALAVLYTLVIARYLGEIFEGKFAGVASWGGAVAVLILFLALLVLGPDALRRFKHRAATRSRISGKGRA